MITISITPDRLAVTGHARAAPPGQDIVCAAVSTLVQTLANALESFTDDVIKIDMQPGRAVVEYKDLSEAGRLLVDSFFLGFCDIAAEYPEYVTII